MRNRIITALAATVLAVPAMAAPAGYFQVPGTETTMQIYGRAQMNAVYGITGYAAGGNIYGSPVIVDGTHQSNVQKNQWDMDVSGSRIGFQTMTPSSFGDVKVKVEGDFFGSKADGSTDKAFRLRHAFGKIGGLTVGHTDSIFMDGDASPSYLDQDGMYTDYYGCGRLPQISYTAELTKELTLQVGMERDKTKSSDKKLPTAIVAGLGYGADWGHVRGAVAFVRKTDHIDAAAATTKATMNPVTGVIVVTPVAAVAEDDISGNVLNWNVGASFNLGKGTLVAMVNQGVGFYGVSWLDKWVVSDGDNKAIKSLSWQLGYSQPVTDTITVAGGFGEVNYKKDTTLGMDKVKLDTFFVNMVWQATKQASFGVEYFGTMIKVPDVADAFTKDSGVDTNKADASRLNFMMRYTFF